MTAKPMKWSETALHAANHVTITDEDGTAEALAIQEAAEPLLAVVRLASALIDAEGDIRFSTVDGSENKIGVAFANLRRSVPAALAAMEEA